MHEVRRGAGVVPWARQEPTGNSHPRGLGAQARRPREQDPRGSCRHTLWAQPRPPAMTRGGAKSIDMATQPVPTVPLLLALLLPARTRWEPTDTEPTPVPTWILKGPRQRNSPYPASSSKPAPHVPRPDGSRTAGPQVGPPHGDVERQPPMRNEAREERTPHDWLGQGDAQATPEVP